MKMKSRQRYLNSNGLKLTVIILFIFFGYSLTTGIIDFDGLQKGEILNTQYLLSDGVTFSATNLGGGPDLAVIFDTADPVPTTIIGDRNGDADQGYPFAEGNMQQHNPHKIAVIAENDVDDWTLGTEAGPSDGLIDVPDDEEDGGIFSVMWDSAIKDVRLVTLDMEEDADGYMFELYLNSIMVFSASLADCMSYDASIVSADHCINQMPWMSDMGNTAEFDELRIVSPDYEPSGSFGIDEIQWQVPEPVTLSLMSMGLGIIAYKRKRR
jgi:hypothetical protein